jgi:hypothetical protein
MTSRPTRRVLALAVAAFARNLSEWQGNALPGATYDVEMVNGMS